MKSSFLLLSLLPFVAKAAEMNYLEINSPVDSNVAPFPNLILAKNFGGNPGTAGGAELVTVNGVNFEQSSFGAGFNTTTSDPLATVTLSDGDSTFDGFAASPTDLGPNLNNIFKGLIRASYSRPDGERDFTIAMADLQIGAAYQVQIFLSSGTQGRANDIENGEGTLLATWDNANRESICEVSFLADQATETITIGQNIGDAAVVSAIMISANPSPTNLAEPTDLSLGRTAVNLSGAVSGERVDTLVVTDPDVGDTHLYSLVPGEGDEDNSSFVISGSDVSFATDLPPGDYTFRVRVIDGAANTYEESFPISVVANQAPEVPTLFGGAICLSGVAPRVAGRAFSDDPNLAFTPEDSLCYSLVDGEGDADNISFLINELTGELSLLDDPIAEKVYSIRVRVTDSTDLSAEGILNPWVVSFVGNELSPRDDASDNDTRVFYTNNVVMEGGGAARGVGIYIQNSAIQNGRVFEMLLLRPTGMARGFSVVYSSGEITVANGVDGQILGFSFPNGPVEVQDGDLFAHYGRGIPFSSNGDVLPIYYPVGTAPVVGTYIVLGEGDLSERADLSRNYAWGIDLAAGGDQNLNLSITQTGGSKASLQWNAKSGRSYTIEASSDMIDWGMDIDDNYIPATEQAEFEVDIEIGGPKLFYRVRQNP